MSFFYFLFFAFVKNKITFAKRTIVQMIATKYLTLINYYYGFFNFC